MIELAVRASATTPFCPPRPTTATRGSTWPPASASSSRPAGAPSWAPASPSRSRKVTPGFVQPRSGLAARHGITIVNAPGLIDSGYRGELKVVLLNTDREEPFTVEPGMRIAQLVVVDVPGVSVVQVDLDLAPVAGVDQTRRVDNRDPMPGGQPRPWQHEPGVTFRDRHREAGAHDGAPAGRELEALAGAPGRAPHRRRRPGWAERRRRGGARRRARSCGSARGALAPRR